MGVSRALVANFGALRDAPVYTYYADLEKLG